MTASAAPCRNSSQSCPHAQTARIRTETKSSLIRTPTPKPHRPSPTERSADRSPRRLESRPGVAAPLGRQPDDKNQGSRVGDATLAHERVLDGKTSTFGCAHLEAAPPSRLPCGSVWRALRFGATSGRYRV